jgi:small-conductance mechanosensitive channel
MQSAPNRPSAEAQGRVFTRTRVFLLLGIVVLLVACFAVTWETRGVMAHLPSRTRQPGSRGQSATLVDTTPWTTAQTLTGMAATAEEKQYAREAERLADHSVDQAFAAALREANLETQQRTLTGPALAISQKVSELKQFVAQDQQAVNQLAATAKGAKSDSAGDNAADDSDLGIAKAQLDLDSSELADLTEALQEAEGDKGAEIKAELEAHEASMKSYDAEADLPAETAIVSVSRNGTLAARLAAWFRQNSRFQLLNQAAQQAQAKASEVSSVRGAMQTQLNTLASSPVFAGDSAGRLARIQARSARRQLLSIYDDRIQTEQRLASVYQRWATQVQLQHRIVLHLLVDSCAWVLAILLAMVLTDALVRRLLKHPLLDERNRHTLRAVLGLSINVIGFGCILLVIFGAPRQIGTMLGLATAALTIVLQDFVLAILGWFVLIGRRGIRVGDVVEIDGISGEVTEVGLMTTRLLETGSLGEQGYPTGRHIALMNGFAIRGKYFNFSTAGQWMWDQFQVTIPESLDRSLTLEKILKVAEEETAADARRAEQEWRRASTSGRLSHLSASPAVNLLPSADGRTVEVRFVTKASERSETQARLYQRVLELLRGEGNASATHSESEAMAAQG